MQAPHTINEMRNTLPLIEHLSRAALLRALELRQSKMNTARLRTKTRRAVIAGKLRYDRAWALRSL
jgi:hypothetical protein